MHTPTPIHTRKLLLFETVATTSTTKELTKLHHSDYTHKMKYSRQRNGTKSGQIQTGIYTQIIKAILKMEKTTTIGSTFLVVAENHQLMHTTDFIILSSSTESSSSGLRWASLEHCLLPTKLRSYHMGYIHQCHGTWRNHQWYFGVEQCETSWSTIPKGEGQRS